MSGVIPGERHAYIVVQGPPAGTFYPHGEDRGEALRIAEESAARLAEETRLPHVVMCVPAETLECALVAQYMGVVMTTLKEIQEAE